MTKKPEINYPEPFPTPDEIEGCIYSKSVSSSPSIAASEHPFRTGRWVAKMDSRRNAVFVGKVFKVDKYYDNSSRFMYQIVQPDSRILDWTSSDFIRGEKGLLTRIKAVELDIEKAYVERERLIMALEAVNQEKYVNISLNAARKRVSKFFDERVRYKHDL